METKIAQYLEEWRRRYQHAREQFLRHWKKGLAIGFVVFIFFKKDIDIAVSLDNPEGTGITLPSLSGWRQSVRSLWPDRQETDYLAGQQDWEPVNTSLLNPPGEERRTLQRRTSAGSDDNLANTFSNLTFSNSAFATSEDAEARAEKKRKQEKYVRKFYQIAQREMEEFGIPASITLAQGLLESNAGESSLASKNNNHFGIKCFSRSCKKGHCSNFTDDHHKDFFRIYRNPAESYRSHSMLLRAKRYRNLFHLPHTDYRGWAFGLKKAGYATDRYYAEKLINLIEELDLQQYDY